MPPEFEVRGIDHVVLRVDDRERALAFYLGVIGLTIERQVPEIGLTQLRAGRSLIDLIEIGAGAAPTDSPNMDHLCLEIAPFDEISLRAWLASHQVEIVEAGLRYGASGEGPSLYVRDPNGNKVELKGPAAPLIAEGAD